MSRTDKVIQKQPLLSVIPLLKKAKSAGTKPLSQSISIKTKNLLHFLFLQEFQTSLAGQPTLQYFPIHQAYLFHLSLINKS